MQYRFSDNVVSLNPSAIREILKYASDPEVVSLSAGNPAPEAFPVDAVREITARLMAERSQPEDLLELQHIHQKFVEAVEKQDAATIAKYDEKFHTSIVKASRNQLLIKINHQTCERIKNFRQRTFQHNQNALNAIMPHAKILAALQAGDADAAEHYMHSHLELVAQDLISMTRDGNVSL